MSDNKNRAAVYIRVSTGGQEREGTSLESQERLCRERAAAEGYEVVHLFRDVLSGADPNRPEYNAMLDAAIRNEFDAIVIYALDRFGRDTLMVVSSLRSLDEAGVKVISVRGQIDRDTPEGRMMTNIEAAFAEMERAKIKIRTQQGIASRRRQGIPIGQSPFGYDHGPDHHWVVNEGQADTVRRMFRYRVEEGLSCPTTRSRPGSTGTGSRRGSRSSGPRRPSGGSWSRGPRRASSSPRASGCPASTGRSSTRPPGRPRRR
jgi:site-specific DNA recombinase